MFPLLLAAAALWLWGAGGGAGCPDSHKGRVGTLARVFVSYAHSSESSPVPTLEKRMLTLFEALFSKCLEINSLMGDGVWVCVWGGRGLGGKSLRWRKLSWVLSEA